jgi:hypothetical protein
MTGANVIKLFTAVIDTEWLQIKGKVADSDKHSSLFALVCQKMEKCFRTFGPRRSLFISPITKCKFKGGQHHDKLKFRVES